MRHFHGKAIHNMSNPFSVLMDESNDKQDKSCIILVRVLMLNWVMLDFSKAIAFMSDTTNVMKGARSSVQKLIKSLSL